MLLARQNPSNKSKKIFQNFVFNLWTANYARRPSNSKFKKKNGQMKFQFTKLGSRISLEKR